MSMTLPDIDYCREMVRKDDPDRYFVSLFAPARAQPALWALYAFNQEVAKTRENVSEPMLGEIRLQWWHEALDGILSGTPREHPVVAALVAHGRVGELKALYGEILSARQLDIYADGPANMDALLAYANGVGGALSEIALRLMVESPDAAALEAARLSGRAWALLGLVRALPFHWQAGRNYVPGEEGADPASFQNAAELMAALQPFVGKMLAQVRADRTASRASAKGAIKAARPVLLLNVLTDDYLKALAKTEHNPFLTPRAESGLFLRLCKLTGAAVLGRS